MRYDLFRFHYPKVDLIADLDTYTTIGANRYRLNLDVRLSYEIISDLLLSASIFQTYDTSPPSETAAKTDFRYTLGFGWSWS